jgi:hypothetical protein
MENVDWLKVGCLRIFISSTTRRKSCFGSLLTDKGIICTVGRDSFYRIRAHLMHEMTWVTNGKSFYRVF